MIRASENTGSDGRTIKFTLEKRLFMEVSFVNDRHDNDLNKENLIFEV